MPINTDHPWPPAGTFDPLDHADETRIGDKRRDEQSISEVSDKNP